MIRVVARPPRARGGTRLRRRKAEKSFTVPTLDMKIAAQLRGLGCGFLPEARVRPHVERGELVVKRTAEDKVAQFAIAWRSGAQRERALD